MAEQKSLPVASGLTAPARKKLVFAYDSKNRRIAKTVYAWDAGTSTWMLTKDVRFVYDGWQMIAELDHTSATGTGLVGSEVDRTFLWGPDLSGSMTGAGGVGGLLSTTYQGITYEVCSDANGNVTGLVPVSGIGAGTLVARFDYDPFGNRVTNAGPSVELCPFGFSSKYLDTETGVVSYELRSYAAPVGKWLNRDPIGENGGLNLYGMVGNDTVNRWDYLGLADVSIKLQRNTRDLFGTYGQLTVTIDNSKLKAMMEKGQGCCRATNVGPYLTMELPPKAKRPDYLRGGSGVSTPSKEDNDGEFGVHPNYDYDRYYTGLFTGRSGNGSLVQGSSTSIANIISDYQSFKPADMSDEDWSDMVKYGISIGNGGIMIHLGDTPLWSGGCILIGTKYVGGSLNLMTDNWNGVELDGVDSSVGEFFVTNFEHNDTANAQIRLTRMLWCAQKNLGKKISIGFSLVGPSIPPLSKDPNKLIPPPMPPTSGKSWWPF